MRMNIFYLFLATLFTLCVSEKELRILGMQAMTGKIWPGGWACIVPVWMAVDQINQRSDILHGYKLVYEYFDHECVAGTSVYKMVTMLHDRPPYVMISGPILSPIATPTAQVSHHWNLTQISALATSPVLSDRVLYPKFYRMSSPDRKMNGARIGLLKKFGWKKIAMLYANIEYFAMVMDDFADDVQAANISIMTQQVFQNDPKSQVQTLKDQDARIIATAMYEDDARAVLCQAYKVGLYGPKIVWLFHGYISETFWKINLDSVECTLGQMALAADGLFLIQFQQIIPDEPGIAGIKLKEFKEQMHNHPEYRPDKLAFETQSDNCYDHIWMIALALNCSIQRLQAIDHPKTLDEFTYNDTDISDILYECMGDTSFYGIGGKYFFAEDGDPERTVLFERVQDNERVHIAFYMVDKNPYYFAWTQGALKWKDGKVPRDSTLVIEQEVTIPTALYIALCTSASVGILVAACFLMFNIVFKDNRTVKMSSPNINNALLFGCCLCYMSVFIKPIEISNAAICQARIVSFCLGFTITFGALFSKTWRIYRIFTNKNLSRMTIKDYQLLAVIVAVTVIVSSVLVIWEVMGPHETFTRMLVKEVYTIGNDEEIRPYVRVCSSEYSNIFSWIIYVIQGALLTFGAFLAWETRHVKIAALNDSHEIGMCLYNVIILSAVGLTLSLLLQEQEIMLYGVTSGCLIIGTTVTQLVVFVPKVYAVHNKVAIDDTKSTTVGTSVQHQPTTKTDLSHSVGYSA